MTSPGGRVVLVLACLVAATIAVRAPLTTESFWIDESASARVVTQPTLGRVVAGIRQHESSPPAWYALAWALRKGSGGALSLAALRWLSVLFSVGTTVLAFGYARALGLSLPGAAVCGLICALSPALIAHGAELRAYSLLGLTSIAFGVLVERAVARASRGRLVALGSVVALGAMTHYFFVFTALVGLLWVVFGAGLRGMERVRPAAAICAGLVPLAAWSPVLLEQYRHKLYAFAGAFSWNGLGYSFARIFGVFGSSGTAFGLARFAVAALILGGAWWLVRDRRFRPPRARGHGPLCAALAVGPVAAAALAWGLGEHIFVERNLIGTAPYGAVAIAVVMSRPARWYGRMGLVAVGGVLVWSAVVFDATWGRSDYKGIARQLTLTGFAADSNLIQFGPAAGGLLGPVGWYLPGHPSLRPRRNERLCGGATFVVSYDRRGGPNWLRAFRGTIEEESTFAAYDHSPRGPRAPVPIYVARVRILTGAAKQAAIDAGGRIYGETPECGRRSP